jgi:hypothetical protein|tara:strand:- start:14062 stop:14319 length:258 start_codon:yes stop_codon:yes gene_type:complete
VAKANGTRKEPELTVTTIRKGAPPIELENARRRRLLAISRVPSDPVTNPATGEVIAHVARFGRTEAENAIVAAKAAFPSWSGLLQ